MVTEKPTRNTFKKEERLNSKKLIEELFNKGSFFNLYPIRVGTLAIATPQSPLSQVLFTVSKKHFKSAVKRNLIKRRLREAYRLNKSMLTSLPEQQQLIAFIYTAKEILPSSDIHQKLKLALQRLQNA